MYMFNRISVKTLDTAASAQHFQQGLFLVLLCFPGIVSDSDQSSAGENRNFGANPESAVHS